MAGALATIGTSELALAVVATLGACVPIGLSLWSIVDITRRPRWAWALAGRSQSTWLAAVLLGTLLLIVGVGISLWYLLVVRPVVDAAEAGRPPGD